MAGRKGGYGQGTIDYHPSGKWRLRISVPGPDGERVRRQFYFETQDEAKAERDRINHEARLGAPVLPGPETVESLFTDWLQQRASEVEAGQLAWNTYRDYERTVRLHIIPAIGKKRLRDNLAKDIDKLLTSPDQAKRAASSRRRLLVTLRQGFALGVRWGLVSKNYADRNHVKPAAVPTPHPDAWSEAEMQRFLTWARGRRLFALWWFLFATGAREGEALGLRWEDVDLDRGEVQFVQQRLRDKAGEPLFGPLKTARSRRTIGIDQGTIRVLDEVRKAQQKLRNTVGADWYEHNLVFTTNTGNPFSLTNMGKYWRRDLKACDAELRAQAVAAGEPPVGLRYLKPHGARHTHASLLIDRGERIENVSRRLGHASTAFTADVYYTPQAKAVWSPALRIAEAMGDYREDEVGYESGLQGPEPSAPLALDPVDSGSN